MVCDQAAVAFPKNQHAGLLGAGRKVNRKKCKREGAGGKEGTEPKAESAGSRGCGKVRARLTKIQNCCPKFKDGKGKIRLGFRKGPGQGK